MKTLLLYREDGPLAKLLGRRAHGVPPSLLVLASLLPLVVVIVAGERSDALTEAALAWLVLLGGLSRGGNLERDRFRWTVPPLLRVGEYAALVWLAPAAGLALIVVLAFHHYDLVYRLRYHPPAPERLGGGWDTRLVAAGVLLAAGALPEGFYAGAGILGALFVAECVASWRATTTKARQGDFPG
ncbi:MAG: hypothetical protein JWM73_1418 [Solirubrobacterales bacterium]|nr:hypothetical protein [Solirubrobacterales bacterium]